jgi:hypothetical protein
MSKFSFRLTLLSAALALLAVSAASALLPTSEDYQPTNPYWNGLASFFTAANASPIDYPAVGTLPENTVLFIIGPAANVTEPRVEALKRYLLEGGTLVLMDETGAVNPILSGLGMKVSVDGHPMLDPVFYYGSWRLPKIIKVASGDLTSGVQNIALNLPSILNIKGSGVAVLAYSSSFSFLDLDGDSQPSAGEPMGPFPIAATAAYGNGRLIIISDSSIFLNGVIGLGDNLKLLRNIAGEKKVYVDVGVWQATPQLAYRNTVLAVYRALTAPELKYSLALTTVTAIHILTHKQRPTPSVEGVDELLRRHPSWDRRLLEALKEARERVGQRG